MKKIVKPVVKYIRELDEVVEPRVNTLHFQTDFKQKTFIGGLASFLVICYVIYFAVDHAITMFGRQDPRMASLEEEMRYNEVGKVSIAKTAKVFIEI
jgi:large-conductance mechanosensitive channel